MVFRCFAEKKEGFDTGARGVLSEARDFLGLSELTGVRLFCRYDIEGITAEQYAAVRTTVLSEPAVDTLYDELLPETNPAYRLAVEALPGQYDQRADSCAQCIQMITQETRPTVKTAVVYDFFGTLSEADKTALRGHLINPVETREASADKPATLAETFAKPEPPAILDGFTTVDTAGLEKIVADFGLAMDVDDLRFMQIYFRDEEKRDPTETELRLVDTYWSDHCRHTTFLTRLEDIKIADTEISAAFERYLELRYEVYGENTDRPFTLMDVGTIAAKVLKKRGQLPGLDISEEVNACSIHIDVKTENGVEDWLLLFKNETHNHPTEIEPFGGAATCIGGAIRDPLSGRSYVYQAMRVTGSGDPRTPMSETLPGKLPQRRITTTAARGYSSYGNQIGLATGLVDELYHPGYVAKRMEIGAVVGAVKFENVRREEPSPGDVVILLGGRTGRDGIGGATGSSKTHNLESIVSMASEVQKGNAPEERKIQRLFRDAEVAKMIKRCNDFGAGGVSVAIGELADGLDIDLSKVRKKYEGLGATELAISESQERMAVVVEASDADAFIKKAAGENLEAYIVADITEEPRMRLRFDNELVADLSREFLNSNGAAKNVAVEVDNISAVNLNKPQSLKELAGDLRFCSRIGLSEMFDSSVGAGTVLAPFGGKNQKTQPQVMAALIPVQSGETSTCSVMSYGFDPYLSEKSPYHGAKTAVTTSIAKLIAAGCDADDVYLSFQEYFEKLRREPLRWGKPFSALLGALDAQMAFGAAAIGGKDSMSGSFNELDIPPTLVSFAIAPADAKNVISPEFKAAGHDVVLFTAGENPAETKSMWKNVTNAIADGRVVSAWAVTGGGIAEGIVKMSFGNGIGFASGAELDWYAPQAGAIIAELASPFDGAKIIGHTTDDGKLTLGGESVDITELLGVWEGVLENVYSTKTARSGESSQHGEVNAISNNKRHTYAAAAKIAKPRVTVFSFPGTNSEIDTAKATERAGAVADIVVIRNLTPEMLAESVRDAEKAIKNSQIAVLPGGFSGGDEPDGSAKFITAFFRNAKLTDAIHELLGQRDGLMLGICNGFQALIKLGLVPFGKIIAPESNGFTLTNNVIGRHQAKYVYTRVASVQSPWMAKSNVGDIYTLPVSHGEGRFIAPDGDLDELIATGRIATQYCDLDGNPTMDIAFNPNGATDAVEGIFSPDGRVFGKMAHSERRGGLVGRNIPGERHQPVFESGVFYYR